MSRLVSPDFWIAMFFLGIGLLILLAVTKKMDLLNNTAVAVTISMLIALGYFHIVDHYLMEFQGLDYWYLFKE